ncbi:MAG: hypothetical protein J6D03_09445 [Clostridia bacterium]|nr:hypothetical protein [Clostridia bacterium]
MQDTYMKKLTDFIQETLVMSHDTEKLLNILEKMLGKAHMYTDKFKDYDDASSFNIFIKNNTSFAKELISYIDNHKFKNPDAKVSKKLKKMIDVMNFFNYYFSKTTSIANGECMILIEPTYSKNVTNMVNCDYEGVLYHVTLKENIPGILKKGLIPKGEDNDYRYIKSRIYMFCENDKDELQYLYKKICIQRSYSPREATLLKIDLNYDENTNKKNMSYNIDFYQDSLYKEDNFVYTYENIPPQFITVIDIW